VKGGVVVAVAALATLGTLGNVLAQRAIAPDVEIVWTVAVSQQPDGALMVEPLLAVDPTDAGHLVATSMAFTEEEAGTMVFSSRDGGRTWQAGREVGAASRVFPSVDPTLDFAPDGTPYLATLHDGFAVWKRGDNDTAWIRTGTVPGGSYDRQWLRFDRTGGEHHGRLYSAGKIPIQVTGSPAQDVAAFSWSDDGGATFRSPQLVLPDPTAGSLNIVSGLVVLEDGSLLAPYHFIHWPDAGIPEGESWAPRLMDGEIAVLRSRDGRQWEAPVRIGHMRKWGQGAQTGMVKGMHSGGLAVGGGSVHAVWSDILDGFLQVMAARSTDGGAIWGPAVRVNQGGLSSNHSNPGIAVDGRGNVGVLWNDRRDDPEDRCFRPYLAVSRDGGMTFASEVALAAEPLCPPAGRWMNGGETQGLVGLPEGGFHAVWVGRGDAQPTSRLYSTRILVR